MNSDLDRNHSTQNSDAIQAAYEQIWELEQTKHSMFKFFFNRLIYKYFLKTHL